MASGLYGIKHSNRTDDKHWGKNCFNSSFPTALACYMKDKDIPAVYMHLVNINGVLKVKADTIPITQVFNCETLNNDNLYFSFETIYQPYQEYAFDFLDGIDMVVKDVRGHWLAPLEVKLTVLPDNSTVKREERQWGSEMVIRSATTSYCAIGMYDGVKDKSREVRGIFEEACSSIQMWDNDFEMTHKIGSLIQSIDTFQKRYYVKQRPLVMQTIWKTQGKSPRLSDPALDILVWSDYAFSRLFIDDSTQETTTMSRPQRATARLARCIWELSKSGKIRIEDIYRQMGFTNQTDKEFSLNGIKWRRYVPYGRPITPIIPKSAINEIIEEGYIEKLSPERRFDQSLYFGA